MKPWNRIRNWWRRVSGYDRAMAQVDAAIDATITAQRDKDEHIALSFARKGKGAQGVQRAMAVRIAQAIKEQRSA